MDFLIHHMLRSSVARFPQKEALVHRNERLSYTHVWQYTSSLAAALLKLGLQRGQRVGIHLEASIPQVISIFSVSMAGGVYVPVNGMLFPEQVLHIARDCGMTVLITSQDKIESLSSVLGQAASLRCIVVAPSASPSRNQVPNVSLPVFSFDELMRSPAPEKWNDAGISKDLAAILYTSGSTGRPKGVMLSHDNVMAGSSIVSSYLEIDHEDRILAVLPFSFDAGMNQLMTAFQQGATLVLINFALANEVVAVLAEERITGLAGVPTLWSLLVQHHSNLKQIPLPHLRYITNTGGAMPQNVLALLRQYLGSTKIFLMYGLTEAFRSTYLPPEELDRRPTSMGKAIPDTEILILNEKNQPCSPGEIGELVHRGPTVSLGYWNQPEATNQVLRPNPLLPPNLGDAERVCYSGDLVKCDSEGFLYYVGRRDTMIKSSGYRISPTEVEETLFSSGKIHHAAVIGIPDAVLGQTIKAFVVPIKDQPVDTAVLLSFCAQKMPRYMVPKSIEIVPELPKTSSGKVDYPALRRREGL